MSKYENDQFRSADYSAKWSVYRRRQFGARERSDASEVWRHLININIIYSVITI